MKKRYYRGVVNKKQQHSISKFGISATLLFLFVFLFSPVFKIEAQYITSPSYQIENPTIVVGAGESTSLSFKMLNSLGEFVIGESTGVSFIGQAGFLYFPNAPIVAPPTPTPGGGGSSGGSIIIKPIVKEYVADPEHLKCKIADFNCDTHVDILDLSILLYHTDYSGDEIAPFDLSPDGVIDLIDASIMFYYWDK